MNRSLPNGKSTTGTRSQTFMGSEEEPFTQETQRRTNTGNSEPYDHSNTNHKGDMPMIKHPYQTCLRMPLSLSRRVWLLSVTSITSMNQTWWGEQSYGSWRTFNKTQTRTHGICLYEVILGHPSDMTFWKTLLIPLTGSFSIHLKKGSKKILLLCCKSAIYRLHILMCQ